MAYTGGVDSEQTTPSSSWRSFKEQAKRAFENGNYHESLSFYSSALHPNLSCPAAERQILLSNMVACRLQIGGTAQAEAAVENAKQVCRKRRNIETCKDDASRKGEAWAARSFLYFIYSSVNNVAD